MKFELYKDKKGEFRWRLKAKNGEIIAVSSEGYVSSAGCRLGIDLTRDCSDSPVEEVDS
jgi:uncharacterized protein YegP (UPF0339 family)